MDVVSEYKKRRQSRLDAKAVYDYRERRDQRWIARMDAEEDENQNNVVGGSGGHGNTKIPFGLCLREGIEIDPDWTPKDAWNALEGKGYSAGDVYKELKSTGKVGSKKSAFSKENYDKAVKDYEKRTKEYNKAVKAQERASRAVKKAIGEKAQVGAYIGALKSSLDDAVARGDEDQKRMLAEKIVAEAKKYDEIDAKVEAAKKKRDEEHQKVSDAENGFEEIKEKYREAVRNSPEYEKAKEYARYEERARIIKSEIVSKEKSLKNAKDLCDVYQGWYDSSAKAAQDESLTEAARGIEERRAKLYKEQIDRAKERIEKMESDLRPFREAIEQHEKKMQKIKGDSDEDMWGRAHDVEADDRTVKETEYKSASWEAAHMKQGKVKYESVRKYVSKPSEEGIIKYVGGGDETGGSCASVSFAFLANMAGYEVLDYRGGQSRKILAGDCVQLVKSLGGETDSDTDDFRSANKFFSKMEEGKLYWMTAGRHASVVRKNEGKYEYLELQSNINNGWHTLDENTLRKRFGSKSRRTYPTQNVMIEAEKLVSNQDFISLLGYINTGFVEQKKGGKGGAK